MMRKFLCFFLMMITGLAFIDLSNAVIYYMGNPGDDFQSLDEAFKGPNRMQGGDTLIIRDGIYSGTDNWIRSGGNPLRLPDGTPDSYTIVKAEHPGKVTFAANITIGGTSGLDKPWQGDSYWQFEGIKWIGRAQLYGIHYIKFLQCAFEGEMPDGNTTTFGITVSTNILLEDCIAYGKGRYKFSIHQSNSAVLRRCIARQDYANRNIDSSMPIAVYSIYSSNNVECQNCIAIDSDQPQFWHDSPTSIAGSFFAPGGSQSVKWLGCISLNMAMGGSFDNADDTGIVYDTCIFWHQIWGAGAKPAQDVIIRHSTIGGLRTAEEMGLTSSQQAKTLYSAGLGIGNGDRFSAENNIITGAFLRAIAVNVKSLGGNVLWNNNENGGIIPTDITDIDPFANSLKYLPRIEPGSDLSGLATDGGDIGANILKRIGQSGTLYSDPGYDEITDEDLWPWPHEDWVKENMGNYNKGGVDPGLPRGDRGFAAYESPFGSPNTLTSYIWEYLGNPIPPGIYGAGNAPPAADDQSISTDEDTPVVITLTGSDPDGDVLTYIVMSDPPNGSLSGEAPDLTYMPNPNHNGSDSFTFKVNDGTFDSNIATVSITVNPVNDPPLADDQSVSTDEDVPVSIALTGSDVDGDSLTYTVVIQPSNGSLSGTVPNLTYTPNPDFSGDDLFTLKVNDGVIDSNTATVSITVKPGPLGQPGKPVHVD